MFIMKTKISQPCVSGGTVRSSWGLDRVWPQNPLSLLKVHHENNDLGALGLQKLRKAAKYEEKRAPSSPGGPVLAHRPPPTPPGSAGGFGAAEGQGRLSLGNAGKMVVAAHRMAPTPPGGFGAAAQCMQPYARALAGPAYRPEAAAASNWLRLAQGQQLQQTAQATQAMQPRSPWAGSPQDVMRAQRALAAMMPGVQYMSR